MKNLDKIKLSEKYTIYKTKFEDCHSKNDLLNRVEQNKTLFYKSNVKNNHSLTLNIECEEFKLIDKFFIDTLEKICDVEIDKVSKFSWVYTQTKNFSADWMHNHKNLHRFDKSNINTMWVCVFYIQVPDNMKKGEGDLVFKTEDSKTHTFTPKENEVIIFSGEIDHMTTPCQSSEIERISYVSNFNFNL